MAKRSRGDFEIVGVYDLNQAQFVRAGIPVLGDTPAIGDFDARDDPGIRSKLQTCGTFHDRRRTM